MLTRSKPWMKLISMMLVVTMLFTSWASHVQAQTGQGADPELLQNEEGVTTTTNTNTDTTSEVYEVTELREERVKHFRLEDGSYVAVQYTTPVHVQDADGNWQDINNHLSESGSEFSTSDARIKFAKKITGNGGLFTLHDGNRKITMSLDNAIKKTTGCVTNTSEEPDETATDLQKLMALDNLSSKILYADILDGVDLEYVLEDLKVKENIIVKEKKDSYQYTFTIKLNNLEAALEEDGSVNIYDPNTNQTVYRIPAGIMYDASGMSSSGVTYALTRIGNGKYALTVTADAEWINDAERVFPVYIDPSVVTLSKDSIAGTSIQRTDPYSLEHTDHLWVGTWSTTFIKLEELPVLPENATITSASFIVTGHEWNECYPNTSYSLDLGIYPILSDWDPETFCYNEYEKGVAGQISTLVYDYQKGAKNIGDSDSAIWEYEWDITQNVLEWYDNPEKNYGFAIKPVTKPSGINDLVFRFVLGSKTAAPLQINYTKMDGLEDYWSYSTQNVGAAGTGYINNTSGELIFTIGILASNEQLFGHGTTLVYNQAYAGKYATSAVAKVPNIVPRIGYGFKMNVNEYLVPDTYYNADGEEITYYIWTDADGTEHTFFPDGTSTTTYKDTDGLLLTLEIGDGIYEITDMNHNVRTFYETNVSTSDIGVGAVLHTKTDRNGNVLRYLQSSDGKIAQVWLIPKDRSAISFENYTYNAYDQLKQVQIYGYDNAPKVKLYYSPHYYTTSDVSGDYYGYLKKIEFINENQIVTTVTYEYNSSGKLIAAHDETSGYSVEYTYTGERVTSVTEYAKDSEDGQKITYTYRTDYTEVRTSGSDDVHGTDDDIITCYIFDKQGRVTSCYSTDVERTTIYGATSGEYETQENVKNNIKNSTAVGGATSNYIFNGGFEKRLGTSNASGWSNTTNISFVEAVNETTRDTHGNYSARVDVVTNTSDFLRQTVFLPEGDYTLSMDICSYEAENVTIGIKATSQDGTDNTAYKLIAVNEDNATDGFVNVSLNFKASNCNSTGGEQFVIDIIVTNKVGGNEGDTYVLVDNVMLEENIGQSGYSMVEFGNFEDSHKGTTQYKYSNYWSTTGTVVYENELLGNVIKLTSDSTATQRIYTASATQTDTTAKTFVVSGMGKGTYQVPSGTFGLLVEVTYSDDSTDRFELAFQNYSNEWQFVSKSITTDEKLVKTIDVSAIYKGNPGVGYFDNIYLTQVIDESTVTTEYYDNGLVQVQRNGYYEEVYVYDENNNLIRMANNRGELYDYTYTVANNVETETYSTFTSSVGSRLSYPYAYINAGELITTVPQTQTKYVYDNYGQLTSVTTYNGTNYSISTERITQHYVYETDSLSRNFGVLLAEISNLGVMTKYFYDSVNGRLLAVINTNTDTGTCYTYDAAGNITSVMPAIYTEEATYEADTSGEKVDYTYNSANLLQSITTEATTYNFRYDNFGKTDSISVGSNEIVSYEYNSHNGKLNTLHYANGFSVRYVYDTFDNISEVWYIEGSTEKQAYSYKYNAYGQLYQFDNLLTGKSILYSYDANKRLIGHVEYDTEKLVNTFGAKFYYDDKSRLENVQYNFDYITGYFGVDNDSNSRFGYQFKYNDDDSVGLYWVLTPYANGAVTYTYDIFKRMSGKVYNFMQGTSDKQFINTVDYEFVAQPNDNSNSNEPVNTSSLVHTYTSKVNEYAALTYTYTYDDNGNITKIKLSNGQEFRYVYDDLGQLLREDNTLLGRTYVYTYDNAGNILTKSEYNITAAGVTPSNALYTYTYEYNDENWGDKLTSFDGTTFTYDEIGNPINYYNGTHWRFRWENGRRLSMASGNYYTLEFEYNDEGIRVSKTVNGVEHTYRLNGSQIIAEEWGNQLLVYLYDADGSPIGMQYREVSDAAGTYESYWFERNLQGDIVAVYSSNGTLLVSYIYDAWGDVTTTYHNGGEDTEAVYNPFRYRGYYYDVETGLYYVSSRYYDPEIGRFINADDIAYLGTGGLTSYNLFAYCGNNPVMGYDPYGTFDLWGFAKGVGRIVTGIAAVAAGVAVCVAGAPVAMIATAAVTITAGVLTTVNGVADIQQAVTGDNFVRDTVFNGNQTAYDVYSGATETVAIVGTAICGSYLSNTCTMKGAMPGTEGSMNLEPGMKLDRYGSQFGRYLTDPGTHYSLLDLPASNSLQLNSYRVLKGFKVSTGIVANGGGFQYFSWMSVKRLIQFGFLELL
ncbi:MAG: DNRLRE domain-containing protein [Lachnospiraceae bacterium]|nr:DNRLRE domain-containing protein [Lachnospiraceae bacterium]